ncbi:clathrin interactor EPSIN 1 [Juglans microcarpa x Juglans regia]|uniref:clathrin interactor EPSIN 1 n=1 Tax=Juglans microcarpa x Juglans regia TaxID=2249226 RepID=UPI001B7DA7BA|nr:clathrin interactor EPSIN 1 [Juglans microcarpa x Juglans regia]
MDFMKVFDQTVREIKREVNLKVLKVPEMEQKVLDATDNEPWGPHGTALAEIAQATKKFTECQMVMSVLWTRLAESGKDWRHVYKALAVIEYLVAHGSERAVDDIIEHTFQISSLSSFEYVEPNGKDMGINVRKKAESIVALLNNKEKIQEVRNKAAANRDKYFGLSSTGITYKSGSATSSSGGYGSAARDGDRFSDSYRDRDQYGEEKYEKDTSGKSRLGVTSDKQRNTLKKGSTRNGSKDENNISSNASKSSTKLYDSDKYSSIPSQSSSVLSNNYEDEFDDFDPRGTAKAAAGSSNKVDLFGQSLVGDLLDAPTSVPTEKPVMKSSSSEVDLFADAAFVSASPQIEKAPNSQTQTEVDLFASQPATASSVSSVVDPFAIPDPVVQPQIKASNPAPTDSNIIDPFAAVPLNNFDGSDFFGAFTSHSGSASSEPSQNDVNDRNNNLGGKSSADSSAPLKKDTFQVKSGIWSDSLSRGLIDLNISAPKKVSLADVGVVGGLSDGFDEREKGPSTSYYMGRAMGAGSGLGRSNFTSSQAMGGNDIFSDLSRQQYQFGDFQK